MNKIQNVVTYYKKVPADEKALVPDTNYELAKQFVTGSPEYGLSNAVKDALSQNMSGRFVEPIDYINKNVHIL